MIPVSRPYITELERAAVVDTLQRGWITQGPNVRAFEAELAFKLHVPFVVACSSGTSALHLALLSAGVKAGDEVLVPDLTYVATANAVRYIGATPVLVDVDPHTWLMDLEQAERLITPKTSALIPVDLYGMPCDSAAFVEFASAHRLILIQDSAQGFLAKSGESYCGTSGDCGTFSFYANKIITTGEGGAVVCWNPEIAAKLKLLRGQAVSPIERYFHTEVGFNYRMTDMQAALGIVQLSRVDEFMAARREVYAAYSEWLDNGLAAPTSIDWSGRVLSPWLFTFLTKKRNELAKLLYQLGIETRPAFVPLHRMPMYARLDGEFPVSCRIGADGISLPTFPELQSCVGNVIDRLNDCVKVLGLR
jgi:perosamine synthetase